MITHEVFVRCKGMLGSWVITVKMVTSTVLLCVVCETSNSRLAFTLKCWRLKTMLTHMLTAMDKTSLSYKDSKAKVSLCIEMHA